MKVQSLIITLLINLFMLTNMTATPPNIPPITTECKMVAWLNNTMNEKIELTSNQKEEISKINRDYLLERKTIMNNSEMLGHHIALLACWDEWRITLAQKLDKSQMNKFMQWQSNVDLLAEIPF